MAELVSQKEGTGWITVSHEAGIALILADHLIVVDLEKDAVVKSCSLPPPPPHSVWTQQWLLNTPSNGLVLALDFYEAEQQASTLIGWRVDPSIESDRSLIGLALAGDHKNGYVYNNPASITGSGWSLT